MNSLLKEILSSNTVEDGKGNVIPLTDSVNIEEIDFISGIIKEQRLSKAVEIGCAMGISSMAIADAMGGNEGSVHYIIDPNQQSQWNNIGINHLAKAGFRNFKLIEDYSEFALPRLVRDGVKVDFGFIDGWHTFDHTLLDIFYINRMLEPGGVMVIDDVHMSSVNRAVRYLYNYPAYRFLGKVKNEALTAKRKVFETTAGVFSKVKYLLGAKVSSELFNSRLLKSDRHLNLDSSMVAFQKVSEDQRPWNWYENF